MKLLLFSALIFAAFPTFGFTPIGPFSSWMQPQIGFQTHGEIGGPMELGQEYRWNIPEITYGFDQSFLDFFGERGVLAVENAVRTLNQSWPDESANLSGFPALTARVSLTAEALGLIDIQSATLASLLEQFGLGFAVQNTFVLRDLQVTAAATNSLVVQRNFDPLTHLPSSQINGVSLFYSIREISGGFDSVEFPLDQTQTGFLKPVAGNSFLAGEFVPSLTRDDIGGLAHLYSISRYHVEHLPSGTTAILGTLVDKATRPGRGKISLIRHDYDAISRTFIPRVQNFNDSYLNENNAIVTQRVQRVITTPDILFSAASLGLENGAPVMIRKSPASRWINDATLNSSTATDGPGVIPPGAILTFSTDLASNQAPYAWGTFTSLGDYYKISGGGSKLPTLELIAKNATTLSIKLSGLVRRRYTISGSTNFTSWANITTVSNLDTTQFNLAITNTSPFFIRAVEGSPF